MLMFRESAYHVFSVYLKKINNCSVMADILKKLFEEERRIYVDYNSTTPLDDEVVAAITCSLTQDWGNPNSDYMLGQHAKAEIDAAASRISSLINGNNGKVVFTSGGTEANNMVIAGLAGPVASGVTPRHVVISNVEHPAITKPLQQLENTVGLEVTQVNVVPYENLANAVIDAIKVNTVLVSIMAANNETGVLMPLEELGQKIRDLNTRRKAVGLHSVVFHSDAAQIVGKESFDVDKLNLDCATIVGHKFYGPRIGALWTRVSIPPLLFGGGPPDRPGTPNTPMIVGLGMAALRSEILLAQNKDKIRSMKSYLENKLEMLPVKVTINCKSLPRLPNTCNVSFGVQATGKEILTRCQRIIASVSAACHSNQSQASEVLINSGISPEIAATAIRLSIGRNASFQMMDEIVQDLKQALEIS